ncbi:MAG: hypothetical protein HYY13_04140 [Nitrospirae bacterium]|nr:hypothetical protein [Nitrospirota bacterium]
MERREGASSQDDGIRRLCVAKNRFFGTHFPPLTFHLAGEDRFELCQDPDGWETANTDTACGAAIGSLRPGIYKTSEILSCAGLKNFAERTIQRVLAGQPAGVKRVSRGVYAVGGVDPVALPVGEFKESWTDGKPPF